MFSQNIQSCSFYYFNFEWSEIKLLAKLTIKISIKSYLFVKKLA